MASEAGLKALAAAGASVLSICRMEPGACSVCLSRLTAVAVGIRQ